MTTAVLNFVWALYIKAVALRFDHMLFLSAGEIEIDNLIDEVLKMSEDGTEFRETNTMSDSIIPTHFAERIQKRIDERGVDEAAFLNVSDDVIEKALSCLIMNWVYKDFPFVEIPPTS